MTGGWQVADAHVDLAWNALERDRDLELAALTVRTHELGTRGDGRAQGMLSWPDLQAGGVAVAVATLRAPVDPRPVPDRSYAAAAQAHAVARGHLAYYRACARGGAVRILATAADLEEHVAGWRPPHVDGAHAPVGVVLALACADPVLDERDLSSWRSDGIRVLGLAHPGAGRSAGGYRTALGLTDLGRRLLPAAAGLGMALDLADASDASFDEASDAWPGPVLVSHTACRARSGHLGALDDARIRAVADRGGVIGLTLRSDRLVPPTAPGRPELSAFVDHVEHVASLTGSVGAVAIGSDLDDPLGRDATPAGLETAADLPRIADALAARGFADDDVTAVMGGTLRRFLMRALEATTA